MNLSTFKLDTENNTNFEAYVLRVTLPVKMAPFSKEDKILIKSSYECKGYNALQFIAEFPDKGWTKNSISSLLVKLMGKFGTAV